MYDEAIAALDRMNSEHANANALRKEVIFANEYIYQIYIEQQDTAKAVDFIHCVDGPDFDGHLVDFAELMNRNTTYREREAETRESHKCRMEKLAEELIK